VVNARRCRLPAFILLAAASALLLSAACPPKEAGTKAGLSPESQHLFSYIPDSEYTIIGFIDLEDFADSEFGIRLMELSPPVALWDKKLGVNLDKFERIALAARFDEDLSQEPEVLVLMSGDLDEEWVMNELGRKSEYFKKDRLYGVNVYAVEEFGFAVPEDGLVAIGTPGLVRESIGLKGRGGKSLAGGDGLENVVGNLKQSDTFWINVEGINRFLEPVAEREGLLKGFTTIRSGFAAVAFDRNADFRFLITCSSQEDADKMASGFRAIIGVLNFLISNADFDDLPEELDAESLRDNLISLLDSVEVDHQDTQIVVTFTASQRIIDFLADVTKSIIASE
jgi:hypothetical protein